MMRGQRGSVLAGVIALSLVMTLAAAGLITMSANTSIAEISSGADLQLHYAAEAGALLGVCWARNYAPVKIADNTWPTPDTTTITRGPLSDGWENIDGFQVKVVMLKPPIAGAGPEVLHRLQVRARDGVNRGVLKISWDIVGVNIEPGDPLRCNPVRANWKEIYDPYNFL